MMKAVPGHLLHQMLESRKKGPPLNEREREVRAELVMAKRLARIPIEQVLDDLGISRATYYRALSEARKKELYSGARDFLIQDLLPRALRVYANALDRDDPTSLDAARDILNGLGILGKHVTVAPGEGVEELSFERWRISRPAVSAEATADSGHPALPILEIRDEGPATPQAPPTPGPESPARP